MAVRHSWRGSVLQSCVQWGLCFHLYFNLDSDVSVQWLNGETWQTSVGWAGSERWEGERRKWSAVPIWHQEGLVFSCVEIKIVFFFFSFCLSSFLKTEIKLYSKRPASKPSSKAKGLNITCVVWGGIAEGKCSHPVLKTEKQRCAGDQWQ